MTTINISVTPEDLAKARKDSRERAGVSVTVSADVVQRAAQRSQDTRRTAGRRPS